MRVWLVVFLFWSSVCLADTYRYVGYVDNLKSVQGGVSGLREYGKKNQHQPSDNTQFIVGKNTEAVIIEISFKDDEEKNLYEKMEADGQLYLFNVSKIVNEGGDIRVEQTFSRPIPIDLNKDWSIKESSKF